MMLDLNKTRRQRKAVELVCRILKITDKQLDTFIKDGTFEEVDDRKARNLENLKKAREAKKKK